MGTLGFCQAERGAVFLVDVHLAYQVVTRVLHPQLDDATWPERNYGSFFTEGGLVTNFDIHYYQPGEDPGRVDISYLASDSLKS